MAQVPAVVQFSSLTQKCQQDPGVAKKNMPIFKSDKDFIKNKTTEQSPLLILI